MVVNTHEAEGVIWVRVRDASLRIYDMSPEELEPAGLLRGEENV
jgi:hypothetical protein